MPIRQGPPPALTFPVATAQPAPHRRFRGLALANLMARLDRCALEEVAERPEAAPSASSRKPSMRARSCAGSRDRMRGTMETTSDMSHRPSDAHNASGNAGVYSALLHRYFERCRQLAYALRLGTAILGLLT